MFKENKWEELLRCENERSLKTSVTYHIEQCEPNTAKQLDICLIPIYHHKI